MDGLAQKQFRLSTRGLSIGGLNMMMLGYGEFAVRWYLLSDGIDLGFAQGEISLL